MEVKVGSPDRYLLLRELARENRRNMTFAESVLWEELRNNELGKKFLRQYIIGDYIVDFLCREDGLIIEVDGEYHNAEEQQHHDEIRTKWLESKGYHVIRFTNGEVINETDYVVETIMNYLY